MNEYAQYGVSAGIISILLTGLKILWDYLKKKEEQFSRERSEWLKSIENIVDKSDKTSRETNTIIRETGGILFGLKALLENQNRNK